MTDDATQAFMEAALWATNDDDGEPLDERFTVADIPEESVRAAERFIYDWCDANADLLDESGLSSAQIGHTLYLDCAGHGSGFFDWSGACFKALTHACEDYDDTGTNEPYVTDAGTLEWDVWEYQ